MYIMVSIVALFFFRRVARLSLLFFVYIMLHYLLSSFFVHTAQTHVFHLPFFSFNFVWFIWLLVVFKPCASALRSYRAQWTDEFKALAYLSFSHHIQVCSSCHHYTSIRICVWIKMRSRCFTFTCQRAGAFLVCNVLKLTLRNASASHNNRNICTTHQHIYTLRCLSLSANETICARTHISCMLCIATSSVAMRRYSSISIIFAAQSQQYKKNSKKAYKCAHWCTQHIDNE